MGKQESTKKILSQRLEAELERLRMVSGLGLELKVVWKPNPEGPLAGEVKDNLMYLYVEDEEKAVQTLRHEFLDYCVSQAIEPYRQVTNMMIRILNKDAYRRKERIVEGLVKLLNRDMRALPKTAE